MSFIEIEEIWCQRCRYKMEQGSKFLFSDGLYVGYYFTCNKCGVEVYSKRPLVKKK